MPLLLLLLLLLLLIAIQGSATLPGLDRTLSFEAATAGGSATAPGSSGTRLYRLIHHRLADGTHDVRRATRTTVTVSITGSNAPSTNPTARMAFGDSIDGTVACSRKVGPLLSALPSLPLLAPLLALPGPPLLTSWEESVALALALTFALSDVDALSVG